MFKQMLIYLAALTDDELRTLKETIEEGLKERRYAHLRTFARLPYIQNSDNIVQAIREYRTTYNLSIADAKYLAELYHRQGRGI